MTYRVCFVCSGNICRSPIGQVVLTHLAKEAGLAGRVEVTSAGMGDWHVGDQADHRARAALRRAGYDGEAHRAAQFQRDWFERNDLILAADATHVRALRTLAPSEEEAAKVHLLREYDPASVESGEMDVADPYYGEDADFEESVRVIERACRGVLAEVQGALQRA